MVATKSKNRKGSIFERRKEPKDIKTIFGQATYNARRTTAESNPTTRQYRTHLSHHHYTTKDDSVLPWAASPYQRLSPKSSAPSTTAGCQGWVPCESLTKFLLEVNLYNLFCIFSPNRIAATPVPSKLASLATASILRRIGSVPASVSTSFVICNSNGNWLAASVWVQLSIFSFVVLECKVFNRLARNFVMSSSSASSGISSSASESVKLWGSHSASEVNSMCRVVSSSSLGVGCLESKPAITPSRVKGIFKGSDGMWIPKFESLAWERCRSST